MLVFRLSGKQSKRCAPYILALHHLGSLLLQCFLPASIIPNRSCSIRPRCPKIPSLVLSKEGGCLGDTSDHSTAVKCYQQPSFLCWGKKMHM